MSISRFLFFFFIKISSKVQNSRYPNIKVRSTQFDPRIYPHQFSHSLNRILNTDHVRVYIQLEERERKGKKE